VVRAGCARRHDPAVTAEYDVSLIVSRGLASETFCYETIASRGGDTRPYVVYCLADDDLAGVDAAKSLGRKRHRLVREAGIKVQFRQLAVTFDQIFSR
jgi:hypothetical protein